MSINYLEEPQYLSPKNDSLADNDFIVLTNRVTINELAKRISDKLRHPVTIIDIKRLDEDEDEKPEAIRFDSDIEFLSMRDACKLFRRYAGVDFCYDCDSFHAAMLKNITLSTTKKDLEAKIEKELVDSPSFFVPSYKAEGKPIVLDIPQKEPGTHRLVIEYHCPILGYRELLFPIFFKDKVIGILFVGQTVVHEMDDKKTTIERIKEDFFNKEENKPEKIFKKFLDEQNATSDVPQITGVSEPQEKEYKIDGTKTIMRIKDFFFNNKKNYLKEKIDEQNNTSDESKVPDANELRRRILGADKYTETMLRYLFPSKDNKETSLPNMIFNSYEKYEEFINEACTVLSKEENDLEEGAKEKRKKYFKKIVNNAVGEYFNSKVTINNPDKSSYEYLQEYLKNAWERFYNAKEQIKNEFKLRDVVLFGDGERINVLENKKKDIYSNDPKDKEYRSGWSYDFSKLVDKKSLMHEPLISFQDDGILDGLSTEIETTNVILLVYPDVVILLDVEDREKHKELYKEMANSIGEGFSRIYSDVALSSANFMKERFMLTLRIYRHESAHISARLNDNFTAYFVPDASRFIKQNNERQNHITQDMGGAISLISHMSSNIGIITGSINCDTIKYGEMVDIVSLFNKWKIWFRDRLDGRSLDIKIQQDFIMDAPRIIWTNLNLFELLLYNLVDNAVKYAYRGSVIRLSWHRSPKNSQYFELTVSSYGPQMEEGNKLYELYTRGKIHTDSSSQNGEEINRVEGDGIGLYVIKRLCDILDLGGVSHTSDPILKYNIPLIKWYMDDAFKNPPDKKKEINLYLRNLPSQKTRSIKAAINDNEKTKIGYWDLTEEYLDARIDRETYITTFRVKVPVDMQYAL